MATIIVDRKTEVELKTLSLYEVYFLLRNGSITFEDLQKWIEDIGAKDLVPDTKSTKSRYL